MRKEDLDLLLNKRVKLTRKNGFYYSGYIEHLDDDTLRFRDKYNNTLVLSLDDVSGVEEIKEAKNHD